MTVTGSPKTFSMRAGVIMAAGPPEASTVEDPAGARGAWGSRPRRVATDFVDCRWMSSPSKTTVPWTGLRSRASAHSSVGFPQPLAPIATVISPGGMAAVRARRSWGRRRSSTLPPTTIPLG